MDFIMILQNIYIIIEMFFVSKIDYKNKIIPNMSVIRIFCMGFVCLVLRLLFHDTYKFAEITEVSLGFIFAGGLFLVTRLLSKDSIGMGDIKLMFALGFFFGLYRIIAILIVTLLIMSVHNIFRLITKKIHLREEVAFAPYIFIGIVLTALLQV